MSEFLIRLAKRILRRARQHNHPMAKTIGKDVEGLAKQLKEDLKWVRECGKGAYLEAGNYCLTWADKDHANLTICDKLPSTKNAKILEVHRIPFKEAEVD